MSTIVRFYKDGKKVKEIISIGYLPVDERPVEGSRHLVTSGALAEAVGGITGLVSETKTIPKSSFDGAVTFDTQVENFIGSISITMEHSVDSTAHINVFEGTEWTGIASDIQYKSGINNFSVPVSIKGKAAVKLTITCGTIADNTDIVCRLRGLGKAFE